MQQIVHHPEEIQMDSGDLVSWTIYGALAGAAIYLHFFKPTRDSKKIIRWLDVDNLALEQGLRPGQIDINVTHVSSKNQRGFRAYSIEIVRMPNYQFVGKLHFVEDEIATAREELRSIVRQHQSEKSA